MVEVEVNNEHLDFFFVGDKRCTYQIGDRVVKTGDSPGDCTPSGTKGTVKGNFKDEVHGELYLIHVDGTSKDSFELTLPTKYQKDEPSEV